MTQQLNTMLASYWDVPGITWEAFKTLMISDRNWQYDPDTLTFYFFRNGERKQVPFYEVQVMATYHGYYGPL